MKVLLQFNSSYNENVTSDSKHNDGTENQCCDDDVLRRDEYRRWERAVGGREEIERRTIIAAAVSEEAGRRVELSESTVHTREIVR